MDALRYQVHVRSQSRERLALIIRSVLLVLRIHHRPALKTTRRLCTGVKRKSRKVPVHHTMRARRDAAQRTKDTKESCNPARKVTSAEEGATSYGWAR
jgi:hypothetical protein